MSAGLRRTPRLFLEKKEGKKEIAENDVFGCQYLLPACNLPASPLASDKNVVFLLSKVFAGFRVIFSKKHPK